MPLVDGRRSQSAVVHLVRDTGMGVLLTSTQPAVAFEHRIVLKVDQFRAARFAAAI